MKGYVHSIETFGTVDGPGIRYVVFMQGCPMRCQYCHNPDTWALNSGQLMSSDEIIKSYDKYKSFLKNGGITCTGGEPLMQMDFLIDIFEKAHAKGIHTCLDTSGVTFNKENSELLKKFDKLLNATNLVMLDIKHIDNEKHRKLTGYENKNILDFALYLDKKNIPIWVRHVVVPDITDNENDLYQLGYFIGSLKNLKAIDVLPYHNMHQSKYEKMGIDYLLKNVPPLKEKDAKIAREKVLKGVRESRFESL